MEKAGDRWWPLLGAMYLLTAVKRVRGMRLIGTVWKQGEERASAPGARRHHAHCADDDRMHVRR